MYEHTFVKVELSSFKLAPARDYHKIVREHEKRDGSSFRYLLQARGYGTPAFYELIFKRKMDEEGG
ncbi:hypothetical protein [Bacillus sp. ISL-47]|uniref:hypothetical protein n=1 Tax=Bacillus sp. ISL-47 TaxID=2819130 RepID=UPI001BE94BF2|nr:hypothetical protein [Bacillus sp. ISL-47]MBT2706560.1 hypothetical protein [Pseudomonas sp. ISL-84]